jgi:predicted peroxiredoxin
VEKKLTLLITSVIISGIFGVFVISPYYNTTNTQQTILIHLSRGDPTIPQQISPANMATNMGIWMQEQDQKVILLLDINGVHIALKEPDAQLVDTNSRLKTIIENGGRVLVCKGCLTKAGYDVNDLIDGVEISDPKKLVEIFSSNSKIISY